jgi:hypothetical protein
MVRCVPHQVSGSTRLDLSCGATFLPEDLTFAPLVLSLLRGTEGSNPSPSSGESPANLNTSIRVDPGRPILAPKKRLVSIPAEWRQGWQGSALAPSRNPVTQR